MFAVNMSQQSLFIVAQVSFFFSLIPPFKNSHFLPFPLTYTFWTPPSLPPHWHFCLIFFRNICHGSDSVKTAKKEIALWFKDEELVDWEPATYSWVYE